jgi:hypothetical protein
MASVGQNWPVRTPQPVSCTLPIPQRKSTISNIHSLIFTKGNVHCAEDSHVRHMVDTLVSSLAPPPLRRLDYTGRHLAPAGDVERPFQEQVPPRGRKRTPAKASDHPAATGETTYLYQDGPDAPGAAGKNSADLETSLVHHPGRRHCSDGIARDFDCSGSTNLG